MAKSSKGEGWSNSPPGASIPAAAELASEPIWRGIEEQDAEVVAGQPPGDGRADDAAAGDDDVVVGRHSYRFGGDVSKGFTIVMAPNWRPVWKSSLRRNLHRVRSAAAMISPSQKVTCA